MIQHTLRKLRLAAIWLAIFLLGLAVGWLNYRATRAEVIDHLLSDARRSAVALTPATVNELTGTRVDVDRPAYRQIKEQLSKLVAADPRVREIRLLRHVPETGLVVQLADSASGQERPEALPGDSYSLTAQLQGFPEVIRTGEATADPLLADHTGLSIAAYAPVAEVTSPISGQPVKDVLAVRFGLPHWRRILAIAVLEGAVPVWVVFGLPIGAWFVLRRQFEQREVIRNLSEAMEQSHSAILILDLKERIEYANRGLCRQMGYARRELIGRNWRDFRGADTPESVFTDLFASVRAGRTWEGEWRNGRKDGSSYPVRGVVTPVKNRDQSISCYVAVFDDVSETKRREAELREARDLAEAGDRAKGQFLATMSHEVRTPLNGIVGFTSLLLDTSLSSEQREYVQTIRSSGEALIQLTGDILDYARIDSGKLKLDVLACDPRDSIEDALDLLATKAADRNLELLHRCGAHVPSAVMADGGRLRQVLVNLIGNAVKFTERGEVEVTVDLVGTEGGETGLPAGTPEVARSEGENSHAPVPLRANRRRPNAAARPEYCILEFKVRDTGIGISPDQHARLFRPFSQLDDSTTRRYGGTGLGLAICRNLVELMGGTISVESQPGVGSTFSFTIRVAVAAPEPPVRDLSRLRVGLAVRPGALRSELTALLSGWNAEVVEVEAVAELADGNWDMGLVAVDDEVAQALAATPGPLPGVAPEKLVALVPISLSSELRAALRMHFRLLINKPVHHAALFGLLSGARTAAPFEGSAPTRFGFRVLVVEDNRMNQRLMERVLSNLGCPHTVVENGRLAVEELRQRAEQYDLVVMDLHMPEMDGIEALQEIRRGTAGPRAQTMWIIAVTADAREQERARGMAAGLNDYLTKPMRLFEFHAALRRFRKERAARKAL